jgi:hypothetical protein
MKPRSGSAYDTRKFFKGYPDFFGPFGAQRLSHRAQAMLVALMVQYNRYNNGSLKLTASVLPHWRSADIKKKARDELIEEGFIVEVFKGRRPNLASLYAVTCEKLDDNDQHDKELSEAFVVGAWRRDKPAIKVQKRGLNLRRRSEQRKQSVCSDTRSNAANASPTLGATISSIVPTLGAIAPISLLRLSDTSIDSSRSVVDLVKAAGGAQ